jgi:hypothetical protein
MNLYLIKRPDNNPAGYDTYEGAVVIATTEDEARSIHPGSNNPAFMSLIDYDDTEPGYGFAYRWVPMNEVIVTRLGIADSSLKTGVVLESYHAS